MPDLEPSNYEENSNISEKDHNLHEKNDATIAQCKAIPAARAGHAMVALHCFKDHLFKYFMMFGGWDGSRNGIEEIGAENDLWVLKVNVHSHAYTWTELPTFFQRKPPGRDTCVMALLGYEEEWDTLDPTTKTYEREEVPRKSILPPPSDAGLTRLLFVFGGIDAAFNFLDDTWLYNFDGLIIPSSLSLSTFKSLLGNDFGEEVAELVPAKYWEYFELQCRLAYHTVQEEGT